MAFKLTPKSSGFKLKPKEVIDDMPPMDMPIEAPVPTRELTRTQQLTNVLGNILSGGGQKVYSETPTAQELEYEKQSPAWAAAQVPLNLVSDLGSAATAGVLTGTDYLGLTTEGRKNIPFSQRFQESPFQYLKKIAPTEKGQKYYETFSENLGALPATSQFSTGARLTNLQKQLPKTQTLTDKVNKQIQTFVNKDFNEQLAEFTRNAKTNKVIKESADAGYVFIPSQVKNSTKLDQLRESTVGTTRVTEAAKIKNQEVTNNLVRKYLNVPENTPLDDTLLENIRRKHGKVYSEISKIKPTIKSKEKTVSQSKRGAMGEIIELPSKKILAEKTRSGQEILEDLKKSRFDSNLNWQYFKKHGDPEVRERALKLDARVDTLENELKVLAKKNGREDLIPKLDIARKEIAKSHLVTKALNPVTGDVDANVFTKLAYQKKLLDPNAQKIAKFNKGFKEISSVPKSREQVPFTVLDVGISTYGAVTGKPMLAAPTVSKFLANKALFRKPAQQRIIGTQINEPVPTGFASLLQIPQVSPQRVIPSEQNIYRLGLGSLLAPLNE